MTSRIRLFNKSGMEMQAAEDEYITIVGDHVIMALLEAPTREGALQSSGLGRKAHWAFPGGDGAESRLIAAGIIDELMLRGELDGDEWEELNIDASCRLDTSAFRRIIRLGQATGLWIRAFEYKGHDLAFTDAAKFNPSRHGIAWLDAPALEKLFKGDHKAADREAESLLARISEAEQAACKYAIYAGRGKRLGDAAWEEPEEFTRIAAEIDEDDIEDALGRLTPESIASQAR